MTFRELAKEIAEQGHSIGNHTDTHPKLTFLSTSRIREEVLRCNDALVAATGCAIRWMVPIRIPRAAASARGSAAGSERANCDVVEIRP